MFSPLLPVQILLACNTVPPDEDNRPLLVAGKPELREYIPMRRDVIGDQEVSQFS